MWSAAFWKAAAERAVKSAAQGVLLVWLGDAGVAGGAVASLVTLDWATAGYAAGGMALLSVLTSVISAPIGNGGPSLANEKVDTVT
jgi:hypothetical protein